MRDRSTSGALPWGTRVAATLKHFAVCIALLHAPGVTIGLIRRAVESSGLQYWIADATALAVVALVLTFGFRLMSKHVKRGPWTRTMIGRACQKFCV